MSPFTAWLPARPAQDFDLIVKIVGLGASVLFKEWPPIAHVLLDRGYTVMAQHERLNGDSGDVVLRIRIAMQPFYSMGHGCDVLVHLGDTVPEFRRFDLQPGSVLLWEPPAAPQLRPILPEGIIAYPVPITELCAQYGEGLPGRAFAAFGALLQLLGFPEEALHHCSPFVSSPRSFAAGWHFARRALTKHDAYSLPFPTIDKEPGRILLTPAQAILLGFAVSSCDCGEACHSELVQSPRQWCTHHTGMAGAMVSVLESDGHPGMQAYRGPQGKVLALLRGDDSAIAACLNGFTTPRILVAADIPDALNLVSAGHHLIRSGLSDGVGILIEDTIARRHQSIDIQALVDILRRRTAVMPDMALPGQPDAVAAMVERNGDSEADVGFVAWGAAQGVVRDAVALCRSFGLRVAGLYPKRLVPFSHEALESFAKSVGRVVIVEAGQTRGYWDRLRSGFSFEHTVLTPQPGQSLTSMDIFLREGLGTV